MGGEKKRERRGKSTITNTKTTEIVRKNRGAENSGDKNRG